jgi:hypothetical protein
MILQEFSTSNPFAQVSGGEGGGTGKVSKDTSRAGLRERQGKRRWKNSAAACLFRGGAAGRAALVRFHSPTFSKCNWRLVDLIGNRLAIC